MHGTKDLKPGTLRGIIADLGLTVDELSLKPQQLLFYYYATQRRQVCTLGAS